MYNDIQTFAEPRQILRERAPNSLLVQLFSFLKLVMSWLFMENLVVHMKLSGIDFNNI